MVRLNYNSEGQDVTRRNLIITTLFHVHNHENDSYPYNVQTLALVLSGEKVTKTLILDMFHCE